MQSEKISKPVYQSKLSLKRSNSDSSQSTLNVKTNTDDQESCSSDQSSHKENDPCPSNVEDSLADFKSPKEEKSYKPILNRFKIDNVKAKKKTLKSKSKSSKKSSSSDVNQPSIESSFFKPKTTSNQTELKESVPCPVCLKPFKDDETCTNHMKTCASKNKVSLKQLLDAKRLQDRQANERKAMGLLAAPVLPEKKKGFRSKNFSTGDDPQLQLVLAMSESLYEAQQIEELEQAAVLAGIPSEYIKEMSDEDRKSTLQKFGFTTNKPATESSISNKSRKKKLMGPTILQTRSKEDKDRVLTERIACIITGDDALTQVQQRTHNLEEREPTVLKSKLLKEIEKTSNKLWDRSRLTKKCNNFYVEGLKIQFLQSDQKLQSESHESKHVNNDDECSTLCNSSAEYEPIDFDIVDHLDKETNSDLSNMTEMNSTYETDFMKKLVANWGQALNDSPESDVIVFVKDDQHIYVHKLIFYVQCSNILLDIEPNNTVSHRRIKNKICWPDKDKLSALAFLEFIYCGTIKKYVSVFDQDNLISQVQSLARLYKVQDLFAYIRNKLNELKQVNEKEPLKVHNAGINSSEQSTSHTIVNESTDVCTVTNHRKNIFPYVQLVEVSHALNKLNSDPTPMLQKQALEKLNKSLSVQNFNDRRITASPDLFESENEEEISSIKIQEIQAAEIKGYSISNPNLNMVVEDINEDEREDAEINQFGKNSDDHQINSQKTIVNLSRTPSPLEDLHEALTPKCRSPEIGNNSKEETLNQEHMQISEAVTPNRLSPVDVNRLEDVSATNKISETAAPMHNSPKLWDNVHVENNNSNNNIFGAVTQKLHSPSIQNDNFKNITLRKENKTHGNMENTNSDSSSKLDKSNVSNTKPQETIEDDFDESIYTAVTPPKSQGMKVTLDKNGINKVKSDLTLFIDKIKRENEKSLLESDSEGDSPIVAVKPRNPFAKRLQDDSYAYLANDGQKGRKKGISLLENQILEDEKKINKDVNSSNQNEKTDFVKPLASNQNQNNFSNKSLSSANDVNKEMSSSMTDDENKDITVDEMEMSRYSKYKKNNKHDNSIAKYRKQLEQHSQQNSSKENSSTNESVEKLDRSKNSSSSKKVRIKSIIAIKSNQEIEDVTLVSDSDDDTSQANCSTVSRLCTSNKNNSQDKEKFQGKTLSKTTISNIENDSTFPLNLLDSPIEPTKVINSTALKDKSNNKVIDLSSESEEEHIYNESTIPYALVVESDNSLKNKKNENKQMDLLKESEKISDEIDAEISKILESSPDFSIKSGNLVTDKSSNKSKEDSFNIKFNQSKKKVSESNTNSNEHEVITLSPISIISSPEHHELVKEEKTEIINNKSDKSEDKESKNRNSTNKNLGFDTIDSACFDDIQFDDLITKSASRKSEDRSARKSHRSGSSSSKISKNTLNYENTVSNAKDRSKSTNTTLSTSLTSSAERGTSSFSPVLSQNKRKSRLSLGNSSIKPTTSQRMKHKSKSPKEPSNLEKKDENLDEDNLPVLSSLSTPKSNRMSSQNAAADNKTSLPNFSILETPELHKELKKFGVKPLNRPNAKLMLTHIYNETQQRVSPPKRASSTSDDDEPPPKKKNVNRRSKTTASKEKAKLNKTKTSNDCAVIAEEMDYDDSDVPNNVDNTVSIKDKFDKLTQTNKDLYNKVLTYEPLSLESLHLMFKQSGFKCKINSLMDFLDEQCITFQVQNSKGTRTKNKKS